MPIRGVAEALCGQAGTLWHVSNLYYTRPQTELAAWLVAHSFADRVFFCNSGAEANEAAIKLARKYFRDRGATGRYRIVSMEKSLSRPHHGNPVGYRPGQDQKRVDPVLAGFEFVPFNDPAALKAEWTLRSARSCLNRFRAKAAYAARTAVFKGRSCNL